MEANGLSKFRTLVLALAGLLIASTSLLWIPKITSAGAPAFSTKPTYGGSITMAWTNDFATLDPAQWDDAQALAAMQSIYDTLVEYNRDNSGIGPGLATKWTIAKDGLTYTFWLRRAKFSNGDPVTAQDVAFSLDRVCQPGANSPYAGFAFGNIKGYSELQQAPKTSAAYTSWSSAPMPLSGVKVLGPQELSITLVHPSAYFLNDLALLVGGIQDPAVVKRFGPGDKNSAYEDHAIGSGPFELQSWTHNQKMVLVRNPNYWGPKPYLEQVVMLVDVNDQTAYELFQRGDVQLILDLSPDLYQEAISNPKTAPYYHQEPENWVSFSYLDVTKPPFNNIYLRQALNYAVDKQQLIKIAVNGRGYSANDGVLPPGVPGWVNSRDPYPYSLAKAKSLLAKSGHPKGLSFNFYIPADGVDNAIAAVLQQDWKKIGVNITIKPVSTSIYWTQGASPADGGPQTSYDAGDAGWVQDYPDPSDFMTPLLTATGPANDPAHDVFAGSNEANYNNPKVDQLVNEANVLPPSQDKERYQLYDEAQTIVERDAPWIFEYFNVQDALIAPTVGPSDINIYLHPIKAMQYQYMWVAKK